MTLEILVSSALMSYTMEEQTKILASIEAGTESDLPSKRLKEGAEKVTEIFDDWEPTIEGYAGFPVDKDQIQKKKEKFSDDRNVGRVVQSGGSSFVITGKKSDGRYIVVGKKGEKSAKDPGDIGLNMQREAIGIDIEDLHQQMLEVKMDGKDDNGFTSCWKGYKKQGTKKKGGKEVNNCVKEEELGELYKGKHGQTEKQYQDGRSDAGKMISGDSKSSGSKYAQGRRTGSDAGPQPAGGSKKPASQGKMDRGSRIDLQFRKAALKKEEQDFLTKLSDSGLFTEAELLSMVEGMQ